MILLYLLSLLMITKFLKTDNFVFSLKPIIWRLYRFVINNIMLLKKKNVFFTKRIQETEFKNNRFILFYFNKMNLRI